MKLGFIGLGKMGRNMVQRLLLKNHEVVIFDTNKSTYKDLDVKGAITSNNLNDFINKLPEKKIIWLMLPAGKTIDETIESLIINLNPGDIIIDGGNSFWKDSQRRANALKEKNINYIDCGTSGGVWGLENGYCLMYGGNKNACSIIEPLLIDLAIENGYLHCGESGAGHFTKMIHNGIEYGIMQAYAEGFELLEKSPYNTDLEKVSGLWQNGSVIRSWLLKLIQNALQKDQKLSKIKGFVEDNGEARWMVQTAIDLEVPVHVTASSLFSRFESRQENSFAMKMLATMRNQFGGHDLK
jgi:6-phosphogluconate dehydrogenase